MKCATIKKKTPRQIAEYNDLFGRSESYQHLPARLKELCIFGITLLDTHLHDEDKPLWEDSCRLPNLRGYDGLEVRHRKASSTNSDSNCIGNHKFI